MKLKYRVLPLAALTFLNVSVVFSTPGYPSEGLNCAQASQVVQVALSRHLNHREMTPLLAKHTVEKFLQSIHHLSGVLTEIDIEFIDSALSQIDYGVIANGIMSGDCSFFDEEMKVVIEAHRALRETFSTPEALAHELRHLSSAAPHKNSPFAQSMKELRENILGQLARRVEEFSTETSLENAANVVARSYLSSLEVLGDKLQTRAIDAMLQSFASSLDPHSAYLPETEAEAFLKNTSAMSAAIGVNISSHPSPYGVRVTHVLTDSPAGRSGRVSAGDVIVAIDGHSLASLDESQVKTLLKGQAGSRVRLTLARIENKTLVKYRVVTLTRELVKQTESQMTVSRKTIRGKVVVTISLGVFYDGAANDVRLALERQKNTGPFDALVLDLRNNLGGRMEEAIKLVGLFANHVPVLGTRMRAGVNIRRLDSSNVIYQGPLVVAVNNGSASASEIVAGDLKDLGRAVIAGGAHTFGKGTVQSPLGAGIIPAGVLTVTIAQFYTASGHSTQREGVAADIVVPGPSLPTAAEEASLAGALARDSIQMPAAATREQTATDTSNNVPVDVALPILRDLENIRLANIKGKPLSQLTKDEQLEQIQTIASNFATLNFRYNLGRRN